MKTSVYMAVSLDGFIADQSGGLGWLESIENPDGDDFGFGLFLSTIDALVMGRKTFETVLAFPQWPYDKPVYVLSGTLKEIPGRFRNRAELLQGSPEEIIRILGGKNHRQLYIDGGATVRSFLERDLIDEITLTWVPVILGGGVRLFESTGLELKFSLVASEVLLGKLVKNRYARIR